MKALLTVSAVALLSCIAIADVTAKKTQDPVKPPAKQEAGLADKKTTDTTAAGKPAPSPEMKKLGGLIAGRWQVDEKYEVTSLTPQGGEAKGIEIVHRGPGGLSLITNYRSAGSLGEYHGQGIVTWSPAENAFKQFWVDNGSPGGELWQGKWEGESLVFTATQKMGEQEIFWKQTLSSFNNDAFTVTFDMGTTESNLKRFMTFKFTRMAKQSAGEHRHGMGMHGRPMSDSWAGPRADATPR